MAVKSRKEEPKATCDTKGQISVIVEKYEIWKIKEKWGVRKKYDLHLPEVLQDFRGCWLYLTVTMT